MLFDDYEEAAEAWPLSGERKIFNRDQWVNRYRDYMAVGDNAFDEDNGSFSSASLPGSIRATLPPTQESVAIAQEKRQLAIEAESPTKQDTGEFFDPEGVAERISRELVALARNLKYNRAADHLVYVSREALSPHSLAGEQQRPDADRIFEAQVQLWVIEQVLYQIAGINEQAVMDLPEEEQNVVMAPVKQLLALTVPESFPSGSVSSPSTPTAPPGGGGFGGGPSFGPPPGVRLGGGAGPRGGGPPAPPVSNAPPPAPGQGQAAQPEAEASAEIVVPVDPGATLTRDFSLSPTGRSGHNAFFDAVRFDMTLRIAADAVPEVLRLLQDGSHITVLNVRSLRPLDPVVALQDGFVFGDQPVMEVDLEAEMLLLREWTVPLMPDSIKEALIAITGGSSTPSF